MVKVIRKRMPRIGCLKLYELLKPKFEESEIKCGRDKLFKILRDARMLVPKKLCEYAEIKNEAIFYAYGNRIEIWSKHLYEDMMDVDADDFADLAEDVMGEMGGDDE